MFGFKIFVRVQTFRRVPPVLPRNFYHPAGDQQLNQFKHLSFHPWRANCEGASWGLSLPAVLELGKFNFREKFNFDERVCLQIGPHPFQLFVGQKKAWEGGHQVDSIFAIGLFQLTRRPKDTHVHAYFGYVRGQTRDGKYRFFLLFLIVLILGLKTVLVFMLRILQRLCDCVKITAKT